MAWQDPKTVWTPDDPITDADLARIEGNTKDLNDRVWDKANLILRAASVAYSNVAGGTTFTANITWASMGFVPFVLAAMVGTNLMASNVVSPNNVSATGCTVRMYNGHPSSPATGNVHLLAYKL